MVSTAFAGARSGASLALVSLWSLSRKSKRHLKVGEPAKVRRSRAASRPGFPSRWTRAFHVNSNHPSEDYLIPLKLTWTSLGALEGARSHPPLRRRIRIRR